MGEMDKVDSAGQVSDDEITDEEAVKNSQMRSKVHTTAFFSSPSPGEGPPTATKTSAPARGRGSRAKAGYLLFEKIELSAEVDNVLSR